MTKKFYESYIIVDGGLDDAAIEEVINKYEALLQKNKVDLVKTDRIGRKRMAYAIKDKQNGYYVCFEILAPVNIIPRIERTYKLDENILRYLSIHLSSRTRREKEEHFKNRAILQAKYEESKEKMTKDAAVVSDSAVASEQAKTPEAQVKTENT